MKKVLHGLLVMGAAAVLSVGATSYNADAAGITPKNYSVDYANQKLIVNALDGNTKIYVAKATVTAKTNKTTNETVTTVKTAAATEYDAVAKMEIDLSSFAVTKDVYLSVWGNVTTDPTLIKLPAATTKMKAVVDAVDSTVTINDVTVAKEPKEISGTEFRTANGVWKDYTVSGAKPTTAKTTTVKLTEYAQLGATLSFRVKASAVTPLAAAVEIGKDADGKSVMACVGTGNFASNEVKAKIAKTANGPKATIDYNKQTIKIPNTTEYRVQAAATALNPFASAAGTEKTVTIDFATIKTTAAKPAAPAVGKDVEFDLRTAATEKKPASKITEYVFSPIGTVTPLTSANKAISALTQDVTETKMQNADIKVTKMVLNSKTMAGTMTVTNNTTDVYEFVVADPQDAAKVANLTLPTVDDKVTGKVAAGKSSGIKVKSGQYVYVRKAADAKKMVWSTPYAFYGVVMNTLE